MSVAGVNSQLFSSFITWCFANLFTLSALQSLVNLIKPEIVFPDIYLNALKTYVPTTLLENSQDTSL